MGRTSKGIIVLAGLVSVACAPTRHVVQLDAGGESIVIQNVAVVDGTGGPPLPGRDVVVVDGRVRQIVAAGASSDAPVDARVIDGAGKTLLPGFVDAHVHVGASGAPRGVRGLTEEENLERLVRMGVTTAFDLSGTADEIRTLDERVTEGSLAGPHLRHTHLVVTAAGGYPLSLIAEMSSIPPWLARLALPQITTVDDIDRILDELDDVGVDFVKIMVDRVPEDEPILEHALLKELIARARRRGHPVIVHAGHVDDAVVAAEAGATMLAHLPRRGRFTPDQLARLKASGVVVTSTAAMWDTTDDVLAGRFTPTPLDRALIPATIVDAVPREVTSTTLVTLGAQLSAHRADRAANLQALLKAGVPVAVGTDSPIVGTWPGSSYEAELRALLAAGMTPAELIVAMTSRPAMALGGSFGVVAEGRVADLVLVDGDPLADPTLLFRPTRVFVGGREVKAVGVLPAPPPMSGPSASPPAPTPAPAPAADALR